jgi:hypothetical protein
MACPQPDGGFRGRPDVPDGVSRGHPVAVTTRLRAVPATLRIVRGELLDQGIEIKLPEPLAER